MARLLDLFCKAGGAAMGYHRAGFEVVGVDIEPQANYPFPFIQADALEFAADHIHEYDAVHASPECKGFTAMMSIRDKDEAAHRAKHPDFITPSRVILNALGKPYIMENVCAARRVMVDPITLCGTMFGLKVLRHRLFESNFLLFAPCHSKHTGTVSGGQYMGVYGMGGAMWADKEKTIRRKGSRKTSDWAAGMGIDWMTRAELAQAIPPAYTEFLGLQIMQQIGAAK